MTDNILKRIIRTTAVAIALLCTTTACDFHDYDNGDLDGFWHLERVDTLQTGGTCDLSEEKVFWGVQAKLINVSDKQNDIYGYFLRFEHTDNVLRLYNPCDNHERYGREEHLTDDPLTDEDVYKLSPYGINALEEEYNVDHLSSSDMVLSNTSLRLKFTKF